MKKGKNSCPEPEGDTERIHGPHTHNRANLKIYYPTIIKSLYNIMPKTFLF